MEFPADGKGDIAVDPFYSKRAVVLVQLNRAYGYCRNFIGNEEKEYGTS